MRLCLKGRFPSKNLVILSDLDSDGLSEADATAAPLTPADQTEIITYQQKDQGATCSPGERGFLRVPSTRL